MAGLVTRLLGQHDHHSGKGRGGGGGMMMEKHYDDDDDEEENENKFLEDHGFFPMEGFN